MQETFVVNQKQYTVIRLLGHGKGGYSYLVERNGCQYVLKQIHHEPCDYYSFGNKIEAEINDYNRLLQTGIRLPRMLDVDIENERADIESMYTSIMLALSDGDYLRANRIERELLISMNRLHVKHFCRKKMLTA